MKTKTKLLFSAVAASVLIGCGGGGGTTTSNTTGVVSDGYIYNAKVCYLGTNTCTYTNANGEFTLPQKDLPIIAYPEVNTTNMATTRQFSSVLIAPAGITKITPLSTALYAVNKNYDELAKDLNVSADMIKNYINKNVVALSQNDANASVIYGQNVLLEQITKTIMLDSNSSDINKKLVALKSMLDYTYENNKSLSQLTQNDMQTIFTGYKSLVVEPVSDINRTKISIIASSLSAAMDANFTNVENIEKQFSSVDYNSMMNLDDANLSVAANALKETIISLSDKKSLNAVGASSILNNVSDNQIPEINATGHIYVQTLPLDSTVKIVNGKDFNITAGAEYTAQLSGESSDFLTFADGSTVELNQQGDVTLNVNVNKMKNPVETAVLTLTPKNGDVVGESQKIFVMVANPNSSLAGVIVQPFSPDYKTEEYSIKIDANATTHQINDVDKTIDINNTDPAGSYFAFATSSDNKVVSVQDYNDTDVILTPISNGTAKVTVVSLNKQTYAPTVKIYNITVNNVDLPPVLNVYKKYYDALLNNNTADVNITYSVTDADTVNNGYTVTDGKNTVNANLNTENNITETFDTPGLHKVTLSASDGYLNSMPVTVYVNVFQGDVAPTLTLFVPDEVDMDTMTSAVYKFSANDLNGADTFEVNATSSNENVVKVVVDKSASTITLMAQPEVGSATITVWAQDNSGLSSKKYTFTVKTKNEMASLMPTLYLVPPIDSNGSLIDSRYTLSRFDASYDVANGEVLINGEINTSDGNVTLTNFALDAFPDDALYAGKGTTLNGLQYGFIFSNGFSYDGQFKDGRVLVYDENGKLPYYWALATKDEICKAYGDNNNTINLINSLNDKTPINCNE